MSEDTGEHDMMKLGTIPVKENAAVHRGAGARRISAEDRGGHFGGAPTTGFLRDYGKAFLPSLERRG